MKPVKYGTIYKIKPAESALVTYPKSFYLLVLLPKTMLFNGKDKVAAFVATPDDTEQRKADMKTDLETAGLDVSKIDWNTIEEGEGSESLIFLPISELSHENP